MRLTLLLSLLTGLFAATAPAHADMLDEVIGFYNPDLRPARPVIECVLSGTPLQTCVLDAGKAALVDEYGGTLNDVITLAKAVQQSDYKTVIAKGGVIIACSWMSFPGKEVLCSDIGGALVAAGAEGVAATASVVLDVHEQAAKIVADFGEEIVCLITGCSRGGSGSRVTVDAEKAWQDCFVPRLQEGLIARGGGDSYVALISASVRDGLFPANSLMGACVNPLLEAVGSHPPGTTLPSAFGTSQTGSFGKPTNASVQTPKNETEMTAVADQIAVLYQPMLTRYRELTEAAAAAGLAPVAVAYHALQNQWRARAETDAADWFTATVPLGLAIAGKRKACRDALDAEEATVIGRWAAAGQPFGSQSQLDGRTERDWQLADNPQTWCKSTYVGDFQRSIAQRRALYQEAVAGCTVPDAANPRHLVCAQSSTAGAKCLQAFAGGTEYQCEMSRAKLQVTGEHSIAQDPPEVSTPATTISRQPPRTLRPRPGIPSADR